MIDIQLGVRRKEGWEFNDEEQRKIVMEWALHVEQEQGISKATQLRDVIRSHPIRWIINPVLHIQRAELLHSLVDQLSLEVKDWGYTNDEEPHEVVEIILALGSAGVITAIANIIKLWLERNKIQEASIRLPNGTVLNVKRATAEEIQSFIAVANQLLPENTAVASQPLPKKKTVRAKKPTE